MAEADQWYQPPVQEQEELWEEEEQEEQEQEHGDGEPSMKKINLDEGPPGAEEGVEKLPGSYPGKKWSKEEEAVLLEFFWMIATCHMHPLKCTWHWKNSTLHLIKSAISSPNSSW